MTKKFVPPFPKPHKSKASFWLRFFTGMGSWIHTLYEKSYRMKMGDVKVPKVDFFIVNEASLIEDVLQKHPEKYPKHQLLEDMLEPLIGRSMFATNGKVWETQRKMVMPSYAHTNLKKTFDLMEQAVLDLMDDIAALDHRHDVAIDPLMTHIAADVITRTMLSKPLSAGDAHKVHLAFNKFQKYTQRSVMLSIYGFPGSSYYRKKAAKVSEEIHLAFKPDVEARYNAYMKDPEAHQENKDILDALLEARHPETGAPFDLKDLLDQISLIFLAGHETSASSLTWTLYLIANCPHIQERLHAEIDTVFEKDGGLSYEALRKLTLTKNVFAESLRLYPPISFFMREITSETTMRDKKMCPGALLVVAPWLIQRNENYWPEAHSFDPDRFSDPDQKSAEKCAYMPFGKGPRICLGKGFAQQEALIVLAHFLRCYKVACDPSQKPEPVSRVTTRPKKAVLLGLQKRN